MLSRLSALFGNPASDPTAMAILVLIVAVALLFVAFIVIAITLPRPQESEEDKRRLHARTRRLAAGCAVTLAIVTVGLVGASALWYPATSTNSYCTRTCHAMAAASDTWSTSAHNRVTCIRCHEGTGWRAVPTGLVLRISCLVSQGTKAPTRRGPVPQSRCLECHGNLLDITMQARNGELFTHRAVLARGESCTSCHGTQGHVPPRPRR